MASPDVHTFTQENFQQEVLNSSVPVLVDFWAEWCGPCKMLGPILDEVAAEKGAAVKVGKVNVDEQADLAAEYGVSSIPALFYFKGGKIMDSRVGVAPKSQIIQKLEALV